MAGWRCYCLRWLAGMVLILASTSVAAGPARTAAWWQEDVPDAEELNLEPEYENGLDRIILFYDPQRPGAVRTQIDLLNLVPDYTRATVVVQHATDRLFLEQSLPRRVLERVDFVVPSHAGQSIWAQDYFEGDARVKLVPWGDSADWLGPDGQNHVGEQFRSVPIMFEGGNVILARNSRGESVLFVGANDYIRTRGLFGKNKVDLSVDEFADVVRSVSSVDDVVVLGFGRGGLIQQPPLAHIDQLMLPLADGKAAVLSVPPGDPYRDILAEYNSKVQSAGFEMVHIRTNAAYIDDSRSYVNAVVYTHKETQERCVIMPIFPDATGRYELVGLNLRNKRAFEEAGLRVQTVEDRLHPLGGNLHCITLR